MKKKMLLIASVTFILLAAVVIFSIMSQKKLPQKKVIIHGTTFNTDIADTDMSRMIGLSGRKSLDENQGMLFIFPIPGQYTFWMKGMNFPLDFVWIANGSVIQTMENIPIPTSTLDFATYTPTGRVDQVLEVNAGTIARTGIQAGDSVQIK